MKKQVPEEFLSLPAGETENYSEIYPFRYKDLIVTLYFSSSFYNCMCYLKFRIIMSVFHHFFFYDENSNLRKQITA